MPMCCELIKLLLQSIDVFQVLIRRGKMVGGAVPIAQQTARSPPGSRIGLNGMDDGGHRRHMILLGLILLFLLRCARGEGREVA